MHVGPQLVSSTRAQMALRRAPAADQTPAIHMDGEQTPQARTAANTVHGMV